MAMVCLVASWGKRRADPVRPKPIGGQILYFNIDVEIQDLTPSTRTALKVFECAQRRPSNGISRA
jgi:hypothetical protein